MCGFQVEISVWTILRVKKKLGCAVFYGSFYAIAIYLKLNLPTCQFSHIIGIEVFADCWREPWNVLNKLNLKFDFPVT